MHVRDSEAKSLEDLNKICREGSYIGKVVKTKGRNKKYAWEVLAKVKTKDLEMHIDRAPRVYHPPSHKEPSADDWFAPLPE